jgi:hypothetical protein
MAFADVLSVDFLYTNFLSATDRSIIAQACRKVRITVLAAAFGRTQQKGWANGVLDGIYGSPDRDLMDLCSARSGNGTHFAPTRHPTDRGGFLVASFDRSSPTRSDVRVLVGESLPHGAAATSGSATVAHASAQASGVDEPR